MNRIEQCAITLVASGTRHLAADDLFNTNGITDDEYEAAIDLAGRLAAAIYANPGAVLALVRPGGEAVNELVAGRTAITAGAWLHPRYR
jgi:hypothetical protein